MPKISSSCFLLFSSQMLRIQLGFLKAYLFTCCQSIADDFRRQVWPKEYYYDCIHVYSISVSTCISISFCGSFAFASTTSLDPNTNHHFLFISHDFLLFITCTLSLNPMIIVSSKEHHFFVFLLLHNITQPLYSL